MIKMGWEDIIKRPFDVSRAREEALEDYDKTLSNIQIMKKYLDPYFNASVRGGSRIMSGENRWYDTGEIKRIKPVQRQQLANMILKMQNFMKYILPEGHTLDLDP